MTPKDKRGRRILDVDEYRNLADVSLSDQERVYLAQLVWARMDRLCSVKPKNTDRAAECMAELVRAKKLQTKLWKGVEL